MQYWALTSVQVRTKLRNRLQFDQSVALVHVHHHLRLARMVENVGWRLPVLEWAGALEVAEAQRKREEAGEPAAGSYVDLLTSAYGSA